MTEFLIGCGGWAFFQVPGLRPLEAYAKAFNFVEVNSTFYKIPSLQLVESWRRRVPEDFQFSVRCHRDVTHKYQLEPTEHAFEALNTMIMICRVLNSTFLVLQTPPKMDFNREKIESTRNLLSGVNLKGVTMVWEVRQRRGETGPADLIALMNEYGIVHCVDLSKETPATESNTVYTRVFGKGQHNIYQFTDEELREIDKKTTSKSPEKAAVSFHNVKMYKDAARYKIYKETGKFPSATGAEGQQSLRKVLMEDSKFPTTKAELLKAQGWKVIDLTEDTRVHAYTLLDKLPDRQFRNIEEVLESTGKIIQSFEPKFWA